MAGLSTLGIFHTLVSLVAIACGVLSLARDKEISTETAAGKGYLLATLLAAGSALGIFRHGGFGPPHALAVLTLGALAVGTLAAKATIFGRISRYVSALAFSSTILFHETLTRLPTSGPVAPSVDAPIFKILYPVLLLAFLIGISLQLRWLQSKRASLT